MSARPKWFLNWTAASASAPEGDGRPWGDGSEMAGRQARSLDPWDENCGVRPILGGFEAMSSMAQALQGVIDEASKVSSPFDTGSRKWVNGHVYIADWRFNCLRDLSHENAWLTDAWGSNTTATRDLTAIGLVRKLMQAGIQVRVMLWLPSWLGGTFADLSAHIDDHFYAARLVEAENVRLMAKFGATAPTDPPLGVVALDMRTADVVAPSHHQKQLVVRSPWRDVAFAGGVDLAYTRRDAPVLAGDWQSNSGMPKAAPAWPRENGVDYASVAGVAAPGTTPPTDLPAAVYGTERHIWHDQHLHLEGPVVATLEASFAERWALAGRVYDLGHPANVSGDQVIMSSPLALTDGAVIALPDPAPVKRPPGGLTSDTAAVQLWRTLPLHPKRTSGPHQRGEFTVMLGVAEACKQARELIWIFDQYLWSRPLCRLLHRMMIASPSLHVVVVLPPHADTQEDYAHQARRMAIGALVGNPVVPAVASRVAVYSMWNGGAPPGRGVYVHAKVQMYDADLLVCGSANLNRRSFTCDTELALAVADSAVLDAHQRALWNHLFPGPFPALDRTKPGWGKALFDEIARASGVTKVGEVSANSRLILDPWDAGAAELPNGAGRRASGDTWMFRRYYANLLDPSSIDLAVEEVVREPGGGKHTVDLADIAWRLERRFTVKGEQATFPYRRPS